MDYLYGFKWQELKEKLKNKYVFLFLDYDGTLAPIVDTPEQAVISKETRLLLEKLSNNPRIKVAIISGRAISDVKNKIGLKNITYVGNHGLEIEGPKIKFENPSSLRYKKIFKNLKSDLNKRLSSIRGIILEDKGLSLSIHYRLVDKGCVPKVKSIVHETTTPYTIRNKIAIKPGKKVLEVRPQLEWDKGKIVLWLLARQKFILKAKPLLPIYIGDDISDEDAFSALKNKGITIFVGKPKSSKAGYYLKNPQEVSDFLSRILEIEKT